MKENLKKGDVVQLGPNVINPVFQYCFMVVTDIKSWGCQGYVQSLGKDGNTGGLAYYRAKHDEMQYVGKSVWFVD
jgi:hypothetical protein